MTKVKITKAMGEVEELSLLSAFKVENNTYAIFDSEKLGSMGLPIIYVSKVVDEKLEKINDTNEWQSAKNYLKGIINGTNFEYIKLKSEIKADEAYFTPLTLPSQSALELIKSHYTVPEDSGSEEVSSEGTPPVLEPVSTPSPVEDSIIPEIPVISASPTEETNNNLEPTITDIPSSVPPVQPVSPIPMSQEQATTDIPVVEPSNTINNPIPNELPTIPDVSTPVSSTQPVSPIPMPQDQIVTDISTVGPVNTINNPVSNEIPAIPNIPITNEINQNNSVDPVMPNNDVVSNTVVNSTTNVEAPINTYMATATPTIPDVPIQPINEVNPVTPVQTVGSDNLPPVPPLEPINNQVNQVIDPIPSVPPVTPTSNVASSPVGNMKPIDMGVPNQEMPKDTFDNDRETFLKACENMFDALISKYQKQLTELDERERVIKQKEMEIEQKMQNANEHLANAAAREQVANIAHDNAQKVMDLNNFMPTNNINNTNNTQAGVI